jgi:hypothetical protein
MPLSLCAHLFRSYTVKTQDGELLFESKGSFIYFKKESRHESLHSYVACKSIHSIVAELRSSIVRVQFDSLQRADFLLRFNTQLEATQTCKNLLDFLNDYMAVKK